MKEILKSFEFEAEGVKLILNIQKELHGNYLRIVIDGDILSNNLDLRRNLSTNCSSDNISLIYGNSTIFWISTNEYKGLRWENYSNETKFSIFRTVNEMKEAYIIQRDFVPVIGNYFFDCIKTYKTKKVLFETKIEEILEDEKL